MNIIAKVLPFFLLHSILDKNYKYLIYKHTLSHNDWYVYYVLIVCVCL